MILDMIDPFMFAVGVIAISTPYQDIEKARLHNTA